jgi:hypothetical protein
MVNIISDIIDGDYRPMISEHTDIMDSGFDSMTSYLILHMRLAMIS